MLGVLILFACQEKTDSGTLSGDSESDSYAIDCGSLSVEECPEECNIFTGRPEVEDSEGNSCIDLEMDPQPASCGEYAPPDAGSPVDGNFFAEDDNGICWVFSSSFVPTGWAECGPIDECQ